MKHIALALASSLALSAASASQSPTPLVLSGQPLPGGGTVTGIGAVHVGSAGDWLVETSTDLPQSPALVLRWSGPWKKIGDPLVQPTGATIADFGSFSTELFGGVAWVARLAGTAGGATDDEAVYFESSMWMQKGPVTPGFTNLPAGSQWLSFADVRCSSDRGSVLIRGRLDDPTIAGTDESYLALGWLCGSVGVLCGVDRLISAGQPAPGLEAIVEEVRLAPARADVAPTGGQLVWSCDLRGFPTSDGCVYRYDASAGQHVLLAREGSPAPVPGRDWGPLDSPAVDVNSSGSWTLCATLDASDPASDAVLVQDDVVLAREGDVLPSAAPAVLLGFGRGAARIDEAGRVVWYGRLSEPSGNSEALFRDGQLLVRTGVTRVGGRLLVGLDGGVDALSLSSLGNQLVFRGTLEGGVEGAFTLDLSGP
ncbi:MAG: hypothetical protein AAF682_28200 [Planctomycetota bacterium]